MTDHKLLADGMSSMGLKAEEPVLVALLGFLTELRKWNRSYNLISSGDMAQVIPRHFLDALSIHGYVSGKRLLDVGTGAGFPGLPLALLNPELECTLLDSVGKKVRFLRHVKRSVGISNIHPEELRVEDYHPDIQFDVIVSRAFSSLDNFTRSVRHLVGPETRLLAMKGKHPEEELKALPEWLKLSTVVQLQVPGLHAERHLVIMSVAS
jgi:16S rRNA (guanine527-N7)-methyltransferase